MRLFVAFDVPEELRTLVQGYQERLGAPFRRAPPHLTLKYLGEVAEEKVRLVVAALRAVEFSPFTLATTKNGSFTGVVWVGVRLTKHLAQLQQAVARAVREFTTHDPRPYKPHVTIARHPALTAAERGRLAAVLAERPGVKWKAESFVLYRSEPTPSGPVYHVVERFP